MRTISQLLIKLNVCESLIEKYKGRRDFKTAFINATTKCAQCICEQIFPSSRNLYLNQLFFEKIMKMNHYDIAVCAGEFFKEKANRIKYWPEVKTRLIKIGVKL